MRHLIPVTSALEAKDAVSNTIQRVLVVHTVTVFELVY